MKLEKLSALAELVSSIAIVITLVYLAVQTQQNTRALQANARQASLESELEMIYKIIDHPFLYQGPPLVFPNTNYSQQELSQIAAFNVAMFRTRESYWIQYRNGALDSEIWESYRSVLAHEIRTEERLRWTWSLFSEQFNPEFVEEVNTYLAE